MLSNCDRYVPKDVVNEILYRLPVKSLLRFKCVCKYCYTLIKSPEFIRKHFHHENNQTRLLVQHHISDNDRFKYAFSLFPDKTLAGIPPLREDLDLHCPNVIGHIVGPFDGLFFLHNGFGIGDFAGDFMALWNPATREFRLLPVPHPIFPPQFRAVSHTFGFGFDPLTSNYKFIWIRSFTEDIDEITEGDIPYFVVALHSLGSDSWRYLDPLMVTNHYIHNSLCATCINGAYYWLLYGNDHKYRILSFDMRCEVFKVIEGPDHPKQTWGSLTLHNDSITLFIRQNGVSLLSNIIDIWVMKEEGCWTKLLTVKPFPEVSWPLGLWKNTDLLLESCTHELVLYNHDTREIRNLGVYGVPEGCYICLRSFIYKESLHSVKGRNEDWKGYDLSEMVRDFFKVF